MYINVGYELRFNLACNSTVVALLNVHPSRERDLRAPDEMRICPTVPVERFNDGFGNRCCRFLAPAGTLHLRHSTIIQDSGLPDEEDVNAAQIDVNCLPRETLPFLLSSRYCEVDLLSEIAWGLFGNIAPGWPRVRAVCDWVHAHLTFGYEFARPTRTANEALREKKGVCRDFQHLAIAFCRCLNIPARYATGYLGDIRIAAGPDPMDFNAWFEAYLGDRWWIFDARHRQPRIGRVLMARGRDAADVAFITSFGQLVLTSFKVVSKEIVQPDVWKFTGQSSPRSKLPK